MTKNIEKTEARQGERKVWQEHTLITSLLAAVFLVGGGLIVFAVAT